MGKKKQLTPAFLKAKGVPAVLIAGLITASVLGWKGFEAFSKTQNYYAIKSLFPDRTTVVGVVDGDTVEIKSGLLLRLIGIDAPARGKEGYKEAIDFLKYLCSGKKVTLEYDAYQDDKYGRILAYIWIPCVQELSKYCRIEHKGEMLVNEVMIKEGKAEHVIYPKRKRLRYEDYFVIQ